MATTAPPTSTSRLRKLRQQLAALRGRQQFVGLCSALAVAASVLLLVLAATFAVDYAFEPNVGQRVGLIVAAVVLTVSLLGAWAWPLLDRGTSSMDLAVWVEKQHGIDSDLVAALQFEDDPHTPGSPQLRQAVIDYVAESAGHWNIFEGFSARGMWKRLGVAVLLAAVLAVPAAIYWHNTNTFFQRLLLSELHYPTATRITAVTVGPAQIGWDGGFYSGGRLPATQSPYGQPVHFQVEATGWLPHDGRITLTTGEGRSVNVDLERVESGGSIYQGVLPRLLSSVQYSIRLGDAWTDPSTLGLLSLPTLSLQLVATPPEYVSSQMAPKALSPGARSVQVLQGSSVGVDLISSKPLGSAVLVVGDHRIPLIRLGEAPASDDRPVQGVRERWCLGLAEIPASLTDAWNESPLSSVNRRLGYSLEVTDTDGLAPEVPVEGLIELRTDQPPQVTASVNYSLPVILPQGRLNVAWNARDDYGLERIELVREITRSNGQTERETVPLDVPFVDSGRAARSEYSLRLADLDVKVGDELRVMVRAFDRRPLPEDMSQDEMDRSYVGKSETIVLRIASLDQVHAAISEYDLRALDRSEEILRRESEIGGGL